ncbi:MAG: hypothetical protein V4555_03375 [Acidobacteriota bacterium]
MSMELYVFLNRAHMLSPEQWQQAIDSNGFDLQLDHDFDQFTFIGFLPCNLAHRSTGFEYYFSSKEDVAPTGTYLAAPAAAFDSVVSFVWGGNFDEFTAVLMAAASLANSCPSLLHVAEDDSSVGGDQALAYARQELKQIAAFRK